MRIALAPYTNSLNRIVSSTCLTLLISLMNVNVYAQNFHATFEHNALTVSDLDASANFYQEVLGLKEIRNETQDPTIRWFSLGTNLELHLITGNTGEVSTNKSVHMAVGISNFDAFVENLRSENIPFSDWPGNKNQVSTRPDGVKQVYLQDPDGYWIEVNSKAN